MSHIIPVVEYYSGSSKDETKDCLAIEFVWPAQADSRQEEMKFTFDVSNVAIFL